MIKQAFILAFALCMCVAATAQNYRYFFGNIHAHTAYSDGAKDRKTSKVETPDQAFTWTEAHTQHFDFLGISEHNHSQAGMQYEHFSFGVAEAKAHNERSPHRLTALYGMEFGVIKNGGHVLVYGLDSLIGWEDENYDIFCEKGDYASLWKIIKQHPGAIATLAHPEQTDYSGLITAPYNKTIDDAIVGVAINTGPAFSKSTNYSDKPAKRFGKYYQQLLAKGYKVGPTMDHDNHNTTFGQMSASRTVVLAEQNDAEHILDAYRAIRFYASEDYNAKVLFTINGRIMGSSFTVNNENLDIKVSVDDEDGEAVKTIRILYGKPKSAALAGEVTTTRDSPTAQVTDKIQPGESFYFYAEITQADGDKITTAPIWVKRS